jgi:hypothetical protein
MIPFYWTWRSTVLVVLSVLTVAVYLGALAPVQGQLEALAKANPIVRAASLPSVAQSFTGTEGRADAYLMVFAFLFVSPLALIVVGTLLIFLITVLATAIAPVFGGRERVAMLVVEALSAVLIYVERDVWLPHAQYVIGLLARAYVVITA